jgi:hypothetical protein
VRTGRAALGFIFVTILLDMLALGVIVPVLPTLVTAFQHGDTARAAETIGLYATVCAPTKPNARAPPAASRPSCTRSRWGRSPR